MVPPQPHPSLERPAFISRILAFAVRNFESLVRLSHISSPFLDTTDNYARRTLKHLVKAAGEGRDDSFARLICASDVFLPLVKSTADIFAANNISIDDCVGASSRSSGTATITPLASAAAHADCAEKMVMFLLDVLKADPNKKSKSGVRPLPAACAAGSVETARALLSAGADPNGSSNVRDASTPLIAAVSHDGSDALVEMLLKSGAFPGIADERQNTPLIAAVCNDADADVFRLLLKWGADPHATDGVGVCVTQYVAHKHRVDLAKLLIEFFSPAIFDDIDTVGGTLKPLHELCSVNLADRDDEDDEDPQQYLDMLHLVIKSMSDIKERDDDGKTALHVAAENDALEAFQALLEATPGFSKEDIDGCEDHDGETPRSLAGRHRTGRIKKFLEDTTKS